MKRKAAFVREVLIAAPHTYRNRANNLSEIVHWGWVGWSMPLQVSFVPTEKALACAMAAEEGQKWPLRRRKHPNSTDGAPNRLLKYLRATQNQKSSTAHNDL